MPNSKETVIIETTFSKRKKIIPCIYNSIRKAPGLIMRKPAAGRMYSKGFIRRSDRIDGCFVMRLTKECVPDLLFIISGEIAEMGHEPGARALWYFVLKSKEDDIPGFSVIREKGIRERVYPGLCCRGFELRGEAGEPVYLKIDIEGKEEIIRDDVEIEKEVDNLRFFFFSGYGIKIDDKSITGVTGFYLRGEFSQAEAKRHILGIKCKIKDDNVLDRLRGAVKASFLFESADEYEINRKGRFLFEIDNMRYSGEEYFPGKDNGAGPGTYEIRFEITERIRYRVYVSGSR